MRFRFQRRIKLLPGITINLSKSGISTSIGTRGAHVTLGHGKVRETVGLPGTGLSYTHTHPMHANAPGAAQPVTRHVPPVAGPPERLVWPVLRIAVFLGMAAIVITLLVRR